MRRLGLGGRKQSLPKGLSEWAAEISREHELALPKVTGVFLITEAGTGEDLMEDGDQYCSNSPPISPWVTIN